MRTTLPGYVKVLAYLQTFATLRETEVPSAKSVISVDNQKSCGRMISALAALDKRFERPLRCDTMQFQWSYKRKAPGFAAASVVSLLT